MFRLIIFLFILYLIYKGIRFFFRYLFYTNNNSASKKTEGGPNSKYKDVEDAKILEIKNDPEKPEHLKEN